MLGTISMPIAKRMRRGGRPGMRRMQTGGSVFCPQGNYGRDGHGNTICV